MSNTAFIINGTWRRRCAGEYEHVESGWTISKVEQHRDYGGGYCWIAVNPNGYSAMDPFDTLGAAKEAVDEVLSG